MNTDNKGCFLKGHSESKEQKEKRINSLKEAWKNREDYLGDIKKSNLYNIWRSFKTTIKGKKIGNSTDWDSYKNFYYDMIETYNEGDRLTRINKDEKFCKENCIWLNEDLYQELRSNIVLLTFNNETLSLKEWSKIYNINYNGLRQRYYSKKSYTVEEILFGKIKGKKKFVTDISHLNENTIKKKISKMLSSYRIKDKKKGFEFDLDYEFMLNNIVKRECTYCKCTNNIGCDRIYNDKGHTKDNVVPCCYTCNTTRNNNFTFEEMKKIGKVIYEIKKES